MIEVLFDEISIPEKYFINYLNKIKKSACVSCLSIMFMLSLFSCSNSTTIPSKKWLGENILISDFIKTTNYYHMFDSTNVKVGSMVFGSYFENGLFIARDTSQFDNGSVYETAEFQIDTSSMKMHQIGMDYNFGSKGKLNIMLKNIDDKVVGTYKTQRDSIVNSKKVDSIYKYDAFRGELYMLLNTLNLKKGDSLLLDIFVPFSLNTSKVTISSLGEEKIKVPYFDNDQLCDKIKITSDGKMPDNVIWISKTLPRRMLKINVPNAKLNLVLVNVK